MRRHGRVGRDLRIRRDGFPPGFATSDPRRASATKRDGHSGRWAAGSVLAFLLVAGGCGGGSDSPTVSLETTRLEPEAVQSWALPAVESGASEIVVRQVFTAKGPCRELEASVSRRYPGEYMLRVIAEEAPGCGEETPHIGYRAALRSLPAGTHQLRIVHVGADGSTLAETVFEHPIVVTGDRSR